MDIDAIVVSRGCEILERWLHRETHRTRDLARFASAAFQRDVILETPSDWHDLRTLLEHMHLQAEDIAYLIH